MKTLHKSVLVAHSARRMRELVEDIEKYPAFLPWCDHATILSAEGQVVRASIRIRYRGLNTAFTTENHGLADQAIEMRLVEGPFRTLLGVWRFGALDNHASKVTFDLSYEFSNMAIALIAGPVFHKISDELVDAFVRRADDLYGDSA